MQQDAACEHNCLKQAVPVSGAAVAAAHHGHKPVKGIQVAETHKTFPHFIIKGWLRHMEMEEKRRHNIFHKIIMAAEIFFKTFFCNPPWCAGDNKAVYIAGFQGDLECLGQFFLQLDKAQIHVIIAG